MQTLRHKFYGIGEVIAREVKNGGIYITARFANGKEVRLSIPESFAHGNIIAEGALKDEVDAAIAKRTQESRDAWNAMCTASTVAKTSSTVRGSGRKHPIPAPAKGTLESDFEEYLIRAGYKLVSDSGHDSTVPAYVKAVRSVLEEEGLTWDELRQSIFDIISLYDVGGPKESFGCTSTSTPINALKRFGEFVTA